MFLTPSFIFPHHNILQAALWPTCDNCLATVLFPLVTGFSAISSTMPNHLLPISSSLNARWPISGKLGQQLWHKNDFIVTGDLVHSPRPFSFSISFTRVTWYWSRRYLVTKRHWLLHPLTQQVALLFGIAWKKKVDTLRPLFEPVFLGNPIAFAGDLYESGNEDPSTVCVNPRSSVWVHNPQSTSGDPVDVCTHHCSYDACPCEINSLNIRKD